MLNKWTLAEALGPFGNKQVSVEVIGDGDRIYRTGKLVEIGPRYLIVENMTGMGPRRTVYPLAAIASVALSEED